MQVRLTYNYWRKGGYSIGSEDYRWEILKARVNNTFIFTIFNLGFIAIAQNILLLAITAPTYVFLLLAQSQDPEIFGLPDLAISRAIFFFIVVEYFADQQQWDYQTAKHDYLKNDRVLPDVHKDNYTAEDLERGFAVSGLWSWSRHPNFVCEQAVWLGMYLWAAYRTENYFQWTGLGAVGYLLIFQGSTRLTEAISAGKYPEYVEYQARVGRFLPRLSAEASTKPSKKKTAAIAGAESKKSN